MTPQSIFIFLSKLPVCALTFVMGMMVGGLLYMLAGTWLPPSMRIIHSLEILADSFVHAAALVWLLANTIPQQDRATFTDRVNSAMQPL